MSATYETTNPAIEATPKDKRGLVFAISALVVLLDRITKHIVAQQLPNGQTYTVIPGIFRISDVHNTGAALTQGLSGKSCSSFPRWPLSDTITMSARIRATLI